MDTRNTSRMLLYCKEIKPIRCKKTNQTTRNMSYSPQKTSLAHRASLRTEFTGQIVAKSTSPGLLDTTFFAHWGGKKVNSMITTSQLGKILC